MLRVALAFAAGAGLAGSTSLPWGVAGILLALVPIGLWTRPRSSLALLVVGAGLCGFGAAELREAGQRACPPPTPGPVVLIGRLEAATGDGSAPFVRADAAGCPPERVWFDEALPAGRLVEVRGTRRTGYGRGIVLAREGRVVPVDSAAPRTAERGSAQALRWALVRHRAALQERIDRLYGPRGGLVSALVLARREGLARETRTAFARSGIAHLLAISGFHVGVVAGLLLAGARAAGAGRRRAVLMAAGGSWAYVTFLGFPEAATRAALILSWVGLAAVRGRPSARWGPLAAALLILLVTDPSRAGSVGVQLSFLGAAAVLAWSRPLERWFRLRLDELPGRWRTLLGPVSSPLAAGVAATAATLPVVAWHFEEISLVGIPVTLVASPLVALALPGALLTLALDPVLPGAAVFLAGGVDVLLAALVSGTEMMADRPWASAWIPRRMVAVVGAGTLLGIVLARRAGVGARSRRVVAVTGALTLVVGWPLLAGAAGRGALELRMLDVGQGDAVLLRTPRGWWVLVDAGPPPERTPGPVMEALAAAGIARLELLVLTHPDLDHVGEAPSILRRVRVGWVLDPGLPVGKTAYAGVLEAAVARGIPWRAAAGSAERSWTLDGVTLRLLHPVEAWSDPRAVEANDASVVLLVEYGDFQALLPGDAPAAVERAVLGALPTELEVLKAGHHGSRTSTDPALVARTRPRVALVSAGRGNRYGHPAPEVVERLERAGARILRTDRDGTVRIRARADGEFRVLP